MRVQRSAAEARKMLAAANDSLRSEASEKIAPYSTTPSTVAAAARVPMTFAEAGRARSSTGASVVLNPKAFTARATNSPCSRMRRGLPRCCAAIATACAEGMGAERRATGRRCRLRHRRSESCALRTSDVASLSSARVCAASTILRRKRMMPAGRTSLSHARSRPVSSVPRGPLPASFPRLDECSPSTLLQNWFQPLFQTSGATMFSIGRIPGAQERGTWGTHSVRISYKIVRSR
jgi:hypothetical protein